MENFVVSARKYRPDSFETVVGQPSITRTLKNAIKTNQIAHAHLFCGPRGVGKTTCARIFAKTINCSDTGPDGEACNKCESCKSFNDSRSFNIHELDAASNNHVEDIRNLIDQVRIPPQIGKYSVYIIDEVHMLSQQAFNAFLKTLEEPPAHAVFILATTEKHKIIPTILSRCQIFDFKRITVREMMAHLKEVALKEAVSIDDNAVNIIAQKAEGSMRDALSIFDQVVSFSGKEVDYLSIIENLNVLDYDYYFRMTEAFIENDYRKALTIFDKVLGSGFDERNYLNGLGKHFRDILMCKDESTIQLMELSGDIAGRYIGFARQCPVGFLMKSLEVIGNADIHFRQAKDTRLHVEIALLKLSSILQETEAGKLPENTVASSPEQPKPITVTENQVSEKAAKPQPPTTTGIKTGPRIKEFLENRDDKTEPVLIQAEEPADDNNSISELNQENLLKLWQAFAELIKDDQPRLFHTLSTQLPVLGENNSIRLDLNNPLQEKALKSIHYDLVAYLKKHTGVEDISLQTLVAMENNVKKLYTSEDKFKHMQEQNPQLGLFKNALNLDFE